MLFADKEINIINMFRHLEKKEIGLIPNNPEIERICQSILESERWENWIDSSGKEMPPPDFYNDKECLMMDVMRVDDHGFKKKGKIINPTLTREHDIEKKLLNSGILETLPNLKSIFIIADSGLPTEEDHNYTFYLENFIRTINNHKSKINNYRNNHYGHKIIFFIFDESTAYIESKESINNINLGSKVIGRPHLWFFDISFFEPFRNSEVDYLIWFAPYKHYKKTNMPYELPVACVFDINNMDFELQGYDASRMVSSEI